MPTSETFTSRRGSSTPRRAHSGWASWNRPSPSRSTPSRGTSSRSTSSSVRAVQRASAKSITQTRPRYRPRRTTLRKTLNRLERGANPLISYTQDDWEGARLGPTGANNTLGRYLHDFVQGELDRKRYHKIYKQASSALGMKGKQAPALKVTSHQPAQDVYAFVSAGKKSGKPTVHLTPLAGYDLAHGRPYAKAATIHELRHVEQHRTVGDTMPEATREGDAQLFAQHLARRLYGIPNSQSRNAYNDRGYTASAAKLKRQYGPLLEQTYSLALPSKKKLRKAR